MSTTNNSFYYQSDNQNVEAKKKKNYSDKGYGNHVSVNGVVINSAIDPNSVMQK